MCGPAFNCLSILSSTAVILVYTHASSALVKGTELCDAYE